MCCPVICVAVDLRHFFTFWFAGGLSPPHFPLARVSLRVALILSLSSFERLRWLKNDTPMPYIQNKNENASFYFYIPKEKGRPKGEKGSLLD